LDAEDTEFRVWRLGLVQRNATGLVALTKLGILTAQVFGRIVLRRWMVRPGGRWGCSCWRWVWRLDAKARISPGSAGLPRRRLARSFGRAC